MTAPNAATLLEHGYRLIEELLKGHRASSLSRCGVQKTVWELVSPLEHMLPHMVDRRKQAVLGACDVAEIGKVSFYRQLQRWWKQHGNCRDGVSLLWFKAPHMVPP